MLEKFKEFEIEKETRNQVLGGTADPLSALGLTDADITGGDRSRFLATVVLNDGRTFSSSNTGTNIVSSA